MSEGLSALVSPLLVLPPDEQAASAKTTPASIAASARPRNRRLRSRMGQLARRLRERRPRIHAKTK
ncbi:MAG: hypothetical protein ACXVKA_13865, partial [Acidimicrobiia bacterium]